MIINIENQECYIAFNKLPCHPTNERPKRGMVLGQKFLFHMIATK
jgi:hypothetical protein